MCIKGKERVREGTCKREKESVCVWVCVCMGEKEKVRERMKKSVKESVGGGWEERGTALYSHTE